MPTFGIKWTPELRNVAELKHWDKNPRQVTPAAYERLKSKLWTEGMHQVLTIDTDNTVLSGNIRLDIHIEAKREQVWCMVPERALTEEERNKIGIQANISEGTFDIPVLLQSFDIPMLISQGIPEIDLRIEAKKNVNPRRIKPMVAWASVTEHGNLSLNDGRVILYESEDLAKAAGIGDPVRVKVINTSL